MVSNYGYRAAQIKAANLGRKGVLSLHHDETTPAAPINQNQHFSNGPAPLINHHYLQNGQTNQNFN